MSYTIIIDAGHGGTDPGAVYNGRYEKDDNLSLALEVGRQLAKDRFNVIYTRTYDVYETPFEKAMEANASNGDFFISFHRNSSLTPNSSFGIETLVYNLVGIKVAVAENINRNLASLGFTNRGVIVRPNLVVLRRTNMPAILIETGFINNDYDNMIFDNKFYDIAYAISSAISDTLSPIIPDINDPGPVIPDTPDINDPGPVAPNVPDINDPGPVIPDTPDINDPGPVVPNIPATPESPIIPPATPESPVIPPATPESPIIPPATPESPVIPPATPESPVIPPATPESPVIPPATPESPVIPPATPEPPVIQLPPVMYRVQAGAFKNYDNALTLAKQLEVEGFPAFIKVKEGIYRVYVGAFEILNNAINMEKVLRRLGYQTFITTT